MTKFLAECAARTAPPHPTSVHSKTVVYPFQPASKYAGGSVATNVVRATTPAPTRQTIKTK